MNAYLQQLQQFWLDRTDQERRLMAVAGPLLLVAIFYWGLWQPLQQSLELAQKQVVAETKALAQVKQNANRYVSQGGQTQGQAPAVRGSLSQLASRSAKANRLVIERMQPQGDKLQLWLEDAEFDRLMGWLAELNGQGVQINALDLSATDESGLVQIRRLQLTKP
ncbi:type II secretion system protein M [uncultured Ferrimonas sp.]|uniref:type II secretion system protein M n=1 Tax=uncultured Ferrimonas sp. TaxID=432640 RepID=UPI0026142697|nr:type II secretion system protein M [uncultured Ferrimonas sp.]